MKKSELKKEIERLEKDVLFLENELDILINSEDWYEVESVKTRHDFRKELRKAIEQ